MGRNKITKSSRRKAVWKKTDGICAHCGNRIYGELNQTIDHFIPKSAGGGFDIRNLVPLCKDCNNKRHDKIVDPVSYYRYAPDWVIADCYRYQAHWRRERRSLDGYRH